MAPFIIIPAVIKIVLPFPKPVHQLLNPFINTTMPYKSSQFYNFAAQNIRHLSNVIKAFNIK